ncbi:MAG TPA: hypothetical protein VH475_26960 [Tepidisphaeraceae bacterium]|jgi:hypothetical protein
MSRNGNGLHHKQARFLNEQLFTGRGAQDILRKLKVQPESFIGWMAEPDFVKMSNLALNGLITLRRFEIEAFLIQSARAARKKMRRKARAAATSTTNPTPVPAAPAAPAHCDRELIRLRHGDQAARAFDNLASPQPQKTPSAPPAAPCAGVPTSVVHVGAPDNPQPPHTSPDLPPIPNPQEAQP